MRSIFLSAFLFFHYVIASNSLAQADWKVALRRYVNSLCFPYMTLTRILLPADVNANKAARKAAGTSNGKRTASSSGTTGAPGMRIVL